MGFFCCLKIYHNILWFHEHFSKGLFLCVVFDEGQKIKVEFLCIILQMANISSFRAGFTLSVSLKLLRASLHIPAFILNYSFLVFGFLIVFLVVCGRFFSLLPKITHFAPFAALPLLTFTLFVGLRSLEKIQVWSIRPAHCQTLKSYIYCEVEYLVFRFMQISLFHFC